VIRGEKAMIAELRVTPLETKETFPRIVESTLRVISQSRLQYQLHAMGTTVEGELDEILDVVRRVHETVRKHAERVLIEVSIDDRSAQQGELIRSIEHVRELRTRVPLERFTATGGY